MVLRSPSEGSSSSKMGSETTYFSLAQLPKSRSRQRSLQNGNSACTAESVSVLQIGHLCFMGRILFSANSASSGLKKVQNTAQDRDCPRRKIPHRLEVYPTPVPAMERPWRCGAAFPLVARM